VGVWRGHGQVSDSDQRGAASSCLGALLLGCLALALPKKKRGLAAPGLAFARLLRLLLRSCAIFLQGS